MPISQNKDTEVFFANLERLFRLVKNVLAKGQSTSAEKYIVYLFETITKYYIKKSDTPRAKEELYSFAVTTSNINIESSTLGNVNNLLNTNRQLNDYSKGFLDEITSLIYSQIKPSNFKNFYFIYNLLKEATGTLLNIPLTKDGGEQLLSSFKYICQYILFYQSNLPTSERNLYKQETYNWFLDLLSISVKDENSLILLSCEIREVLRSYIDTDDVDLFSSFLNSLSSRLFAFTFHNDRIYDKYSKSSKNYLEYRKTINKYSIKLKEISSVKKYKYVITEFENEVDTKHNWEINKEEFKNDIKNELFSIFKINYCHIIIVDAISYSFFKEKYTFFFEYLNYHEPKDADARWMNENFSLQKFNQITPFLEDYNKLIPNSFMWVDRHGIETYLNTFLGYYLIEANGNEINNYINTINDLDVINTITYNIEKIIEKNQLDKLFQRKYQKEEIDNKIKNILNIAKQRQATLDAKQVQEAHIDVEILGDFFKNFFDSFYRQGVARAIYMHYNSISDELRNGDNIGINQRLPRRAFIKQSGHIFLSPHNILAKILADDETSLIFSLIIKNSQKLKKSRNEFEEYIKTTGEHFDLLISFNTYEINANFPNISFQESWSIKDGLREVPGYLGKLNSKLETFWLGQQLPTKIFLLLKSKKLGRLIYCNPPVLEDGKTKRKGHLTYSFIDLATDNDSRKRLKEHEQDEETLKSQIWIRIFESIHLEPPKKEDAVCIEIIT